MSKLTAEQEKRFDEYQLPNGYITLGTGQDRNYDPKMVSLIKEELKQYLADELEAHTATLLQRVGEHRNMSVGKYLNTNWNKMHELNDAYEAGRHDLADEVLEAIKQPK